MTKAGDKIIAGLQEAVFYQRGGFVQRELDKLERELHATEFDGPLYKQIYAARQALSWALDPNAFASPYAMLLDKRGDNSATIVMTDGPLPDTATV